MLRLFACLATFCFFGCYDAYEVGGRPRTDAAVVIPDGAVRVDAGRDAGRDAGPIVVDVGLVCRDGTPFEFEGESCSPTTRRCLESCMDDECSNDCILEDPPCVECLIGRIVECAVPTSGCFPEWDEFACCRAERCRGLDAFECFNGPCFDAGSIMFDCFEPVIDMCAGAQELCF